MLIKSADDKSKRLKLLEDLQASSLLDPKQKEWLEDELWRMRKGIAGERDAAHYLDAYYRDGPNSAILHDLRLKVDGEVAQIDHLIIHRAFTFYLLETKNFSGSLSINGQGEFSVTYPRRRTFGIPSPLEQSRRHERVLAKVLANLGITGRVSREPIFEHVVLVHPNSTINRPPAKQFDTSNIIKADQFRSWHENHVKKTMGVAQTLTTLLNIRGQDTVREWAEAIKRAHRPADLLELPDFMKPSKTAVVTQFNPNKVCASCGIELPDEVVRFCTNHADRFGGLLYCRQHQEQFSVKKQPTARPRMPTHSPQCAICGLPLTQRVAAFCQDHAQQFGGKLYCMEHQKNFNSLKK